MEAAQCPEQHEGGGGSRGLEGRGQRKSRTVKVSNLPEQVLVFTTFMETQKNIHVPVIPFCGYSQQRLSPES